MKHLARAAAWVALGLLAGMPAQGQNFPTRPIRWIVGFPPGSILDSVARPIMREMERRLGQPVLLEHKPGANSTIGARYVATAAPDGHTVLFTNAMNSHPLFNKDNAVDPATDLASVSLVVSVPWFLITRASVPATTWAELAAWARSQPHGLRFGSPGPSIDMGFAVLKARTGIAVEGVPYKGSPQIVLGLLGGDVDATLTGLQVYEGNVAAGKMRAIFVAAPARSFKLPNVPTAAEAGIADFAMGSDYGVWAPPGTPAPIVRKLSSEISLALKNPVVAEQVRAASGGQLLGSTPEEQLAVLATTVGFWTEATRIAGFKADR